MLQMEGLKPDSTLVDFGCGTGRLAVHVIPWLQNGGRYIGIDISETMLAHAKELVGKKSTMACSWVEFPHQTTPVFPLPDKSIDLICAFSVFTHMEHENTFLYLRDGRRIIKDHGKFIYSCWPMDLAHSREFFCGTGSQRSGQPVEVRAKHHHDAKIPDYHRSYGGLGHCPLVSG